LMVGHKSRTRLGAACKYLHSPHRELLMFFRVVCKVKELFATVERVWL
jgi:hypothetical protein